MTDKEVERLDHEIKGIHPEYRALLTAHYVRPSVVKLKLERLAISRALYFFVLSSQRSN
ncbi:protein of unknown function [Alcaligenes faecalis subsp. faecalis]|nr:protein of unknown function [Alcaligenes faecalis subsp. faecalis]